MTKHIPVQTVTVVRDGKNFIPPIGKPFDFTDKEMTDIERLNPDCIRKPVNEDPAEVAEPVVEKNAPKGKKEGPAPEGKKEEPAPEGDGGL